MEDIELLRLQAVKRFLDLNNGKDSEFQGIVELAAEICQAPIALITFVDETIQHIKFNVGLDVKHTCREISFCSYTIGAYEVFEVADSFLDKRFSDNPLVMGQPGIRSYAGAPLTTQDGRNVGALCVLSREPRQLSDTQKRMLKTLSRQVINILELQHCVKLLNEQYKTAESSLIKLNSFVESSHIHNLLIGADLRLMSFNKAAAEYFRKFYRLELKVERPISNYIDATSWPQFFEAFKQALAGSTVVTEVLIRYEDNSERWWEITFKPAFNAAEAIIGVSLSSLNIDDKKKHEIRVVEQEESLLKIAQIQSHEIRKPVASIMGLMNIIREEEFKNPKECLLLMEEAVNELDLKIKTIVDNCYSNSSEFLVQ